MARTPVLLLLSLLSSIGASTLVAQPQGEYILKNGQRYPAEYVAPNGPAFTATIPLAGNRQVFNFTLDDIEKFNFPEPEEYGMARRLVASGKPEEAVALLQKTMPALQATRRIAGSWWYRGVIIMMDAYAALGKKAEMEYEASQALQAGLPEAQAAAIRDMLAMFTPPAGKPEEAPEAVKALAAASLDSWFTARCWIEIGNLMSRRGKTEDAVKAWLRAPVFHPAERDLAARGTILAARGLQQMDRAADGLQLIEYYLADKLGSQYNEVMKIEAAKLNPELLKNTKEKGGDKAAPTEQSAPAPATGTQNSL